MSLRDRHKGPWRLFISAALLSVVLAACGSSATATPGGGGGGGGGQATPTDGGGGGGQTTPTGGGGGGGGSTSSATELRGALVPSGCTEQQVSQGSDFAYGVYECEGSYDQVKEWVRQKLASLGDSNPTFVESGAAYFVSQKLNASVSIAEPDASGKIRVDIAIGASGGAATPEPTAPPAAVGKPTDLRDALVPPGCTATFTSEDGGVAFGTYACSGSLADARSYVVGKIASLGDTNPFISDSEGSFILGSDLLHISVVASESNGELAMTVSAGE